MKDLFVPFGIFAHASHHDVSVSDECVCVKLPSDAIPEMLGNLFIRYVAGSVHLSTCSLPQRHSKFQETQCKDVKAWKHSPPSVRPLPGPSHL